MAAMRNENATFWHRIMLTLGILSLINVPGFVFTIPAGVILITGVLENKNRANAIYPADDARGSIRVISGSRSFQPPENGHFITAGAGRALLMSLGAIGITIVCVLFLVFIYHGEVPMRGGYVFTNWQAAIFFGSFGYLSFLIMLFYALYLAHRGILFYYDDAGLTYLPHSKDRVGPIPWGDITGIDIDVASYGTTAATLVIHAPAEVRFNMRAIASPKAICKQVTTAWRNATQGQS